MLVELDAERHEAAGSEQGARGRCLEGPAAAGRVVREVSVGPVIQGDGIGRGRCRAEEDSEGDAAKKKPVTSHLGIEQYARPRDAPHFQA